MNSFAQATQVPSNGASDAEDFQPLTRNPQTTGGGLQPGTGPQSTGGQDILSQENSRIVVPVGSNTETVDAPQTTADAGGINWLLVVIIAAIIVTVVEYLLRRFEKSLLPKVRYADGEVLPATEETSDDEPEKSETVEVPSGILEHQPTPDEPKPTKQSKQTKKKKKTSKKSKSKKKKSRK